MRVEFQLTMPNVGSWNGKWSGEGRKYLAIRKLTAQEAAPIIGKAFHHRWSDGWTACVSVRAMKPRERARKSDGFCGYEWMIPNIIKHQSTLAPGETVS